MNNLKELLKAHRQFTEERNWDSFQTPRNLAMALSVEVAELVELFMWLNDKQSLELSAKRRQAAKEELADILIYLTRLADTLNIDLLDAAKEKMETNNQKHPVMTSLSLADRLND